ncbi:MAG: asparagine synthetase B [Methanobrevibacter sp.]|nr:asparagine synthetase B [Methanobrevibacter sp.]
MCGLIGLSGNFNKKLLFSMIESTKHRGMDSSGYFLFNRENDESDYQNNIPEVFTSDYGANSDEESCFNIGLGHNLLSIFNLINENNEIYDNLEENRQPIITDNLVFIFNGEIYNFKRLEDYLRDHNENYVKSKSDSQLLANLVKYHYDNYMNDDKFNDDYLFESVKRVISHLDGDYSFAVYDKEHDNLALCRDSIGVKPLFYGINDNLKGFASEKKALWKVGFSDSDIKDLKPGSILYNWEEKDLDDDLINRIIATDFKALRSNYSDYRKYLKTKDSYDIYRELLADDIYGSVEKRVENITDVGLIFSGGVDSTILAVILKEISKKRQNKINNGENIKPLNIKLYSVGIENSQDIKFSEKIADDLGLELKTVIIDKNTVRDSVKDVLTAIEDANIMKLGVGMTIYLATKAIHEDGIKVALSGQGADELFGGYNRYLKHFDNNTLFDAYFDLDEEIYHDIANIYHVNLERDDAVSMANGVELRVPFMDKSIINLALDIPASFKIKNGEDLLRKHILRDVAKDIGVPDYIAERPKKAAQYGSGINKILKKKVLKDFDMEGFLESLK